MGSVSHLQVGDFAPCQFDSGCGWYIVRVHVMKYLPAFLALVENVVSACHIEIYELASVVCGDKDVGEPS